MTALTSGASAQGKSIVHLRVLGTVEAANAETVIAADHYSYSRLNRYATCPLSFKLHYLDALPSEPAVELQFGTLLHRTLEALVREHVRSNRIERIAVDDAVRAFRREWSEGMLTDPALFADGLEIVKRWALREGTVDYRNVLGIEQEFELRIGAHRVIGAIDRVDRVSDDTIRVRDYKSHRVLFAQDEVDANLQLSLYDLAARQLWPWAKHVELELDMVRHGVAHRTSRGDAAREATREYVLATVAQIEGAKEFPATPHTHCNRCDHRQQCPSYADALAGKREFVCTDHDDLVAVAKEREEVARHAKILYGRKEELEGFLRGALEERACVEGAGMRYTMGSTSRTEYPLARTVDALAPLTEIARDELVARLGVVNKDALDDIVRDVAKRVPKDRLTLLKATLEAQAKKTFSPRFQAKAVKA
jgi:putative RecB family exonuclease